MLKTKKTGVGKIRVKRGVPWRNGIWKRQVNDGAIHHGYSSFKARSMTEATITSPQERERVSQMQPIIGESNNSFVVTLRLCAHDSRNGVWRTGYRELWSAAWFKHDTTKCLHAYNVADSIQLMQNWSVVEEYGKFNLVNPKVRFYLCKSTGSPANRWQALLSAMDNRVRDYHVMLRGDDCCFECAINQTVVQSGNWFLVL